MTKLRPSLAQQEFIAKEIRHRRQVVIVRFMLLVLLLALWELAADFGWINSFIFSSPSMIAKCLLGMAADGSLFLHTGVTLLETVVSFALVVAVGLAVALMLWCSRSLSEILEPFLVMLNSLPKSALAPLLIVWLGNNMRTIIVAAISVALFGSILTLHTGFSQMDGEQVKLIYSLGGSRRDVLLKVLLPGSLPLIISNMKVNIGLCLVGVIIGEFLSARAGLGYLITYGSQVFAMTMVVTAIVVLCLMSVVLYQGIALIEKHYSR
ncbi:ABC transporter permease [Enterocloster asparagiformis]|uniref:ABC transporter permease n=1 Tax=Enterocloster asparagiformis TaxID=333367 RepID=UPI0004649094|nr:ABC transporter permease [Enterocloster asparagiformis]